MLSRLGLLESSPYSRSLFLVSFRRWWLTHRSSLVCRGNSNQGSHIYHSESHGSVDILHRSQDSPGRLRHERYNGRCCFRFYLRALNFIVRLQISFCLFQVSSHFFSPMLLCPVFHLSVDDCAQVVKCFSPFRSNVMKPMKGPLHRRWANVEHSKQRTCACLLKLLLSALACVLFDNSGGNQVPHNSRNCNASPDSSLRVFVPNATSWCSCGCEI